jgi:type I restriction enzyme S subunit
MNTTYETRNKEQGMSDPNENKSGYKKSKLGWIPEDWDIYKLEELGDFKNGINKSKDEFGKGNPLINLMDVFENRELNHYPIDLINSTEKECKEYALKQGDVLFVRSSVKPSGVGLTALIKKDLHKTTYSGFLIRFRTNKGLIDLNFKKYCFQAPYFRKHLLNKSTISANTNINQNSLNKLAIVLPPIPEQQKIAQILSTWDQAIEKTEQLIEKKQRLKKGLMQQLLSGKVRIPGYENNNWEKKRLNDFLTPNFREVNKPTNDYKALGIRSHGKGTFLKPNIKPSSNSMKVLYKVKANDLIVNITFAWEGAIAIVKQNDNGALVSHRFPTYEFKENASPDFFRHLIKTKYFVYQLGLISPGGAGRNRVLNKNDFLKLKFNIPKLKEQKAIAQRLDCIDRNIDLLEQYVNKLKQQKKGLMQQLLTGKIRVKTD